MAAVASSALVGHPTQARILDFVVIGRNDWLFPVFDEVRRTDLSRIKQVTHVINDAVGALQRAGIATAIALTPAKSRIYRDFLPTDFAFDADSDKRYAVSLALLRGGGACVPDLAATMLDQRRGNTDEPLFLKADTHWTGPGAECAALELARQIKAKLHLPASAQPGTQLGPLTLTRQGNNDLAEGLPEALEAKYGPQSFRVHQVVEAAGTEGLVEPDAPDVLLVGNSFMQPKYGFAAMLSNQLARPVFLAWKVHQSSPYKTLLDTLAARLRLQKPALLVWDFQETDMLATTDQASVWGPNAMSPEAFLFSLRTIIGS